MAKTYVAIYHSELKDFVDEKIVEQEPFEDVTVITVMPGIGCPEYQTYSSTSSVSMEAAKAAALRRFQADQR